VCEVDEKMWFTEWSVVGTSALRSDVCISNVGLYNKPGPITSLCALLLCH
jgi:hypothetical protein